MVGNVLGLNVLEHVALVVTGVGARLAEPCLFLLPHGVDDFGE